MLKSILGGIIMENIYVENIHKLNQKINKNIKNITGMVGVKMHTYPKKADILMLKYYDQIVDNLINLAKAENTKCLKVIDQKYFKNQELNASYIVQECVEDLNYYKTFDDSNIYLIRIAELEKILNNFKFDPEKETEYVADYADSYFLAGEKEKARKIALDQIKKYPEHDDAYETMQIWYMYIEPDISKLSEIVDLAVLNHHHLITDFGLDRLVNFFGQIQDTKSKEKYQKIYDQWKKEGEE